MKEEMLKALLQRKAKAGKMLSPVEKEAKMSVVNDFKDQMSGMMGDRMKGMKKVSVMSDSPQGLEQGLDTAQDLVEGEHQMPSGEMMADDEMEDDHKGEIYEKAEMMSPEELEACIQELQMLKEQKSQEE